MRRLRKLMQLTPADQLLLIEAGLNVIYARVALWVVPFRRLRPKLERTALPQDRSCDEGEVERVTWAVSKVSRLVPAASCLTQALSVRRMLERRRVGCTLKLGVKRDERGVFCAHAWIEHAGRVVIGDQGGLRDFATLPAL